MICAPCGGEHVGVDRQEHVRLLGWQHLERDRVAGDAHGAGLLAEVLGRGQADARRIAQVAVEVRPLRHATGADEDDALRRNLDPLLRRCLLQVVGRDRVAVVQAVHAVQPGHVEQDAAGNDRRVLVEAALVPDRLPRSASAVQPFQNFP